MTDHTPSTAAGRASRREIMGIAAGVAALGLNNSNAAAEVAATPAPVAAPRATAAGVKVEARLVPWPPTISPRARGFLASLVGPDGTPRPKPKQPAPDDFKGWAAQKQFGAAALSTMVARMPAPAATWEKTDIDGTVVYVATPTKLLFEDRAYLAIHGGAFAHGGGDFCRYGAQKVAELHGVRCYGLDYRKPPEHPYPAALHDCMTVYRSLLKHYKPKNIVVGGGSAGGNLVAALALRARDEGLPQFAAAILLTPAMDLTQSGDSIEVNRTVDVVLGGPSRELIGIYAAGHDLKHPYVSPLFGDFSKGFPPAFIQAGTRDLLLSDAVRMHRALYRAGSPAELHIFEGMPHGGFWGAPEDLEVDEAVRKFAANYWGRKNSA